MRLSPLFRHKVQKISGLIERMPGSWMDCDPENGIFELNTNELNNLVSVPRQITKGPRAKQHLFFLPFTRAFLFFSTRYFNRLANMPLLVDQSATLATFEFSVFLFNFRFTLKTAHNISNTIMLFHLYLRYAERMLKQNLNLKGIV